MTIRSFTKNSDDVTKYRWWLRELVGELAPSHPDEEDVLFEVAWNITYIPTVPNDINRAHDGKDLRGRFIRETSYGLPPLGECTMLEFLVALAIRLNDADYDPTAPNKIGVWFWTLIENLGIIDAPDEEIITAFNNINLRDYAYDGYGGLFPLRKPREDQRNVEIWYQMQAYLLENRY